MTTRPIASFVIVLLLGGCASTYELTLMPRTSGTLYRGAAFQPAGSYEARVDVTIGETVYSGTWLLNASDYGSGYASAGFVHHGGRFGSHFGGYGGYGGYGTTVTIDREAKALLRAADGSGLRCDFIGIGGGRGSGTCQDDKGLVYDVQIRPKDYK